MTTEGIQSLLATADGFIEAMRLSASSNSQDVWRFSSYSVFARKYNQLLEQVSQVLGPNPVLDAYNLDNMPSSFETIAVQQKSIFDSVMCNLLILRGFIASSSGAMQSETTNLRDFLQTVLRKAMFEAPSHEREVQNAIEQLLIGRGLLKGVDYDRETGRVKVSAKETVPDFILLKLDLALEAKLVKTKDDVKRAIGEINADIQAYSKQYANLLFVVYDLGAIRDDDEFKNDLDNARNISLIVVKH